MPVGETEDYQIFIDKRIACGGFENNGFVEDEPIELGDGECIQ